MAGDLTFSTDELTGMREAQADHYMDSCTIDVYTDAGADAFGNPNPSWVSGSEIDCGFQPMDPDEVLESSDVPVADGKLRLPITSNISAEDRVTITKRHGTDTTDVTYEVAGPIMRGPSGLVVYLRQVTDGS